MPGILKFDPDTGATLDLLGSLGGLGGIIAPLDPKIILGLSSEGRPITLQDCGNTSSNLVIDSGFSTLAANEINVDPHAALGPVDPQLGEYPAASIVVAAEQAKDPDDRTLILADVSRKALWQVEHFVSNLLEQSMEPARAHRVAHILSSGTWTHDHPLEPAELEAVKEGVPKGVRDLMRLYPQPRGRQESVEYAPSPPRPRERRPGRFDN